MMVSLRVGLILPMAAMLTPISISKPRLPEVPDEHYFCSC
jgi:hypothetical protein